MNLDMIPLWAFASGVILLMLASIEAGFLMGQYIQRRTEDEKESSVSAMAASVLALGAFVLAFAFGIVTNRYDNRRELLREDANVIRTVWLRSDFLPEEDRAAAKLLLREYVDLNRNILQESFSGALLSQTRETARRIHGQLWGAAVVSARKDMNSDQAVLYLDSINEMISVHHLRLVQGMYTRVPPAIWLMLLMLTALGMMGMGYQTGISGSRRSMARPILIIAFAMVITLLADMDRTSSRFIRMSPQLFIDLDAWMTDQQAPEHAGPMAGTVAAP